MIMVGMLLLDVADMKEDRQDDYKLTKHRAIDEDGIQKYEK